MVLLTVTALAVPVQASPSVSDAGFSVNAILPDNQADRTKTYFDLRMSPGQEQELTVSVVNPNSWDIEVTVEAITASTNRNGIINYTAPPETREETLRHGFADLAAVGEEQITVPANSTREVSVAVTMPEEPYDGLILGSLRFLRLPSEEEKNAAAMIVNQYSYVIGVRLRETDATAAADFALGGIGAELVNYRAAVTAEIRNTVPEIAGDVSVGGAIYKKGSAEPLIERSQPGVQMAPNSIYPFSFVDEAGYGFEPGEYAARLTVEHEGKVWSFEQDFTIAAEQAGEVNQGALNQQQNAPTAASGGLPLWVVILVAVVALLLLLAGCILLRIRRENKEFEKHMRKLQAR